MSDTGNSKVDGRAKVWVTPDQVEAMRTATVRESPDYLTGRNDAMIALLYDAGLRVSELVGIDVEHLRDGNGALYLPGDIQKDYPTDNSPAPVTLELAEDTTRTLTQYLGDRWKDSPALYPSRSSARITTQGVRNVIEKAATAASVEPYLADGGRGDPGDVTPHALRHGVAYRMMNFENGNRLYDVRNRLRHRSIQTTERVYDHMIRV